MVIAGGGPWQAMTCGGRWFMMGGRLWQVAGVVGMVGVWWPWEMTWPVKRQWDPAGVELIKLNHMLFGSGPEHHTGKC